MTFSYRRRHGRRHRRRRLEAARLGLLLVACLVVASCTDGMPGASDPDNPGGVLVSSTSDGGRFRGAEPAAPYEMPDVTLEATNGDAFNLVTDTAYPVTLVFFGYTNCPDVCQLVMSDITSAVLQLPDSVREQTQVVFVTTDPARDTAPVLREYLDHYDGDYVGLTGDLGDIVSAAEALGVPIEGRHRLPSGGYDVGHGAQVIGFTGNQAPVLWTEGTPVTDIVDDVVELSALGG